MMLKNFLLMAFKNNRISSALFCVGICTMLLAFLLSFIFSFTLNAIDYCVFFCMVFSFLAVCLYAKTKNALIYTTCFILLSIFSLFQLIVALIAIFTIIHIASILLLISCLIFLVSNLILSALGTNQFNSQTNSTIPTYVFLVVNCLSLLMFFIAFAYTASINRIIFYLFLVSAETCYFIGMIFIVKRNFNSCNKPNVQKASLQDELEALKIKKELGVISENEYRTKRANLIKKL